MVDIWQVAIPQLTGKRSKRRVYIYIPDEIKQGQRFPVLYMFDGHNVFFDEDATYGKSWGMNDYMTYTQTEMIIVGIECSHAPKNGRLSEYSPFTFNNEKLGRVYGRGRITMEWIVNELKPQIDHAFPTLSDRETTFIAGSSMGGLMSLYAISEYNHVFSRCAALSPSVWIYPKRMEKLIASCNIKPDTVVYTDYGQREMKHHKGMLEAFSRITNAFLQKNVRITSRIIPNGDHCEACWEEQVPFFMMILQYNRD